MMFPSNNSLGELIRIAYTENIDGNVSDKQLRPFASRYVAVKTVEPGGYIRKESDNNDIVTLAVSGEFYNSKISEHGKQRMVGHQHVPQFFGVVQHFSNQSYFFVNVVAVTKCTIVNIDSTYFFNYISENASAAVEVIRDLCKTMLSVVDRMDTISFYRPEENLLVFVLKEYERVGAPGKTLTINKTSSVISQLIGTSARTYFRKLNQLKAEGYLTTSNGNIIVTPEQIEKIKERYNQSGYFITR